MGLNQAGQYKMSEECNTLGRKIQPEKLTRTEYFQNPIRNGCIILKLMFMKPYINPWTLFIWLMVETSSLLL
jgi:hypothetical protein